MSNWSKTIPFGDSQNREEIWTWENLRAKKEFYLDVKFGKKLDIVSLKLDETEDFKKILSKVRKSREKLYGGKNLLFVINCPICKKSSKNSIFVFNVYKAKYFQCNYCSHIYLKRVPRKDVIENYYKTSSDYQRTYSEKRTAYLRVKQVSEPKVNWVIEQYKKNFKRNPKTILDVGAGSGHFVYACRKLGIATDGVEISDVGRDFAKSAFNVNLKNIDFLEKWKELKSYDIITFWGLIEHVAEPIAMLEAAGKLLKDNGGIVVAAVPHWNSFSTTIQKNFPESIIRHLDPLGHINCFTDESISTAFVLSGLDIVGAWYFGMDAYELIIQMANITNDKRVIEQLKVYIPSIQERLDFSGLSDEIALVGKVTK